MSKKSKIQKQLPTKEEYEKSKAEKISDWNMVLKGQMDKWTFDEKWYNVFR